MKIYTASADRWIDWETAADGVWMWMLMKSGTFDRTDEFIADLVPATNESDVGGYGRINATGRTRTVDHANHQIVYTCDRPDFGTLTPGQNVVAAELVYVVTDDADSWVVGRQDFDPVFDSGDIDPFRVVLTDGEASKLVIDAEVITTVGES